MGNRGTVAQKTVARTVTAAAAAADDLACIFVEYENR
jgi:hypothetical protein